MEFLKRNWRKLLAGTILCCAALILVINNKSKESSTAQKDVGTVMLSISGEVEKPGNYEIKKGSSIIENSRVFGGFTEHADLDSANVYEPVIKNIVIVIKPLSEDTDYDSLYQIPD